MAFNQAGYLELCAGCSRFIGGRRWHDWREAIGDIHVNKRDYTQTHTLGKKIFYSIILQEDCSIFTANIVNCQTNRS